MMKLARQPGHKESRYVHLLSGVPEEAEIAAMVSAEATPAVIGPDSDRLTRVEEEVASLRRELTELKRSFLEFKGQFDD